MTGAFIGLDAADLASMKTDWMACLHSIAVGQQQYTISGRSFSRANLSEVTATIAEINYAIQIASGSRITRTYADLSNGP